MPISPSAVAAHLSCGHLTQLERQRREGALHLEFAADPCLEALQIIAGRRAITADTDLRFCRFFGLSEGWWLRLQADHDTRKAMAGLAKELGRIKPLKRP